MRRPVALLLALVLLLPSGVARHAAADTAQLLQSLDILVKDFEGGAGVWIADPGSNVPLYAVNADEMIITASLYKLAVMLHAESLIEQGRLSYRDALTIEDEDITEDGSFFVAGTTLTVDEGLEAMITLSDNGTSLAFLHVFGAENINATLRAQNLRDFYIAESWEEDNIATPRAIGMFFTQLAKRQLLSGAASDRMLERLERQKIRDRLPEHLPEGTRVAHKTGNLNGITHDAGIVWTQQGPRVVVGMTWDAGNGSASDFIAGLGSLVYSAVLEPPTNARFTMAKGLSADAGGLLVFNVQAVNAGPKPWTISGPDSVGLVWEMRDARNVVVGSNPAVVPLPAARVNQNVSARVVMQIPQAIGDYAVRVGLADGTGRALAPLGAATVNATLRVHAPFLVTTALQIPKLLHQGEASLVVVQYTPLPALTAPSGPLVLSYRVVDTQANKGVSSATTPLGVITPGRAGTFFAALTMPKAVGTYRLDTDVRQGNVIVSPLTNSIITIGAPRTYPGDETRVTPRVGTRPAPSPRFQLPQIRLPQVQLPKIQLPKGKATPSPSPSPR